MPIVDFVMTTYRLNPSKTFAEPANGRARAMTEVFLLLACQADASQLKFALKGDSLRIAAIRRMPETAKAQSGQRGFDAMLKIAESEILPRNAYLTTLRGVYTETHYCEVFDIQLTLVTGKDSHLTLPIRQVTISSRKIRSEERRELDAKFAALKTKTAPE